MTYKGYSARIEFDGDDQILVGRLLGLNDIVGFHASSVEGLTEAFHEAVDDYIETCRKAGKRPEKVFSGKMMFRVPPDIHARAAFAAEMAGKSLNPWAEEVLAKAAQQNGNVQPLVTPVTCTIIAHNERDRIEAAIRSVQDLVDEVLVVDSGSTDGTQALCEQLGARVVFNPWTGFGPQKRFAEDAARNDWILNLDADEWLSSELKAELVTILAAPTMPAHSFRMRMTMVYPHRDRPAPFADYHNYVRLYDRRATRFANSLVHDEVPATGDVRQLRAPAYHRSFRSLAHLIRKELDYFTLQTREKRKTRASLWLRVPFEFPWLFLKYYFVRRHVFGGAYGFILAIMLAFMRWTRLLIFLGY